MPQISRFLSRHDVANLIVRDEGVQNVGTDLLWVLINGGVSLALVLLGGFFAGLTLALMGQDQITLRVLSLSSDEPQRSNAKKVLSLLQKGKHWVLVTLLLGNVIVNETLPVFLDREMMGGWVAVVVSTGLIVIFGEIIPQSVCAKWGLSIGAKSSTSVIWLMYTLSPIGYPVALLLDSMLGTYHEKSFTRNGLKTLIMLHEFPHSPFHSSRNSLHPSETSTICNFLSLSTTSVFRIMTPSNAIFALTSNTIMDERTRYRILKSGHARVPVFGPGSKDSFIGLLNVRSLITLDFREEEVVVGEMELEELITVGPGVHLADVLPIFREREAEMIIVTESGSPEGKAMGLLTFRDIMGGVIVSERR